MRNRLLILLLVLVLFMQGCTEENKAPEKNQTIAPVSSVAPTATPIIQVPKDLISDQMDKSLTELQIVG